jgi:hypothetical protein
LPIRQFGKWTKRSRCPLAADEQPDIRARRAGLICRTAFPGTLWRPAGSDRSSCSAHSATVSALFAGKTTCRLIASVMSLSRSAPSTADGHGSMVGNSNARPWPLVSALALLASLTALSRALTVTPNSSAAPARCRSYCSGLRVARRAIFASHHSPASVHRDRCCQGSFPPPPRTNTVEPFPTFDGSRSHGHCSESTKPSMAWSSVISPASNRSNRACAL